jgi:hypothetical protein
MTWVSRRVPARIIPLVAAVALGSILSACSSGSANGAVGTSGQINTFVTVDTSSLPLIVVQNRTPQPLVDVNITIKSGILSFTDRISRLEVNERRQIRQGDFTSRDGTSFNLRVARPREIAATGKNLEGKTFDATLPWQ